MFAPFPRLTSKTESLTGIRSLLSQSEDFAAYCLAFGQQTHKESASHQEECEVAKSTHEFVESFNKAYRQITRQGNDRHRETRKRPSFNL